MRYNEISCKSILIKSGIPGIDYALNPYTGCEHRCVYCYAGFMRRFTGHQNEKWGEFVDIKINAPQVLLNQLKGLKEKFHISIGTVCDAYQPVEAKYQITKKCLEILRYFNHSISVLTKSNLILRDLDLLKRIKEIEVGFTITTLDQGQQALFEPNSPRAEKRLAALKELSRNNIKTWVFVAPLIPYLFDSDDALAQLIESAEVAGARNITFDSLNPYPMVWSSVINIIKQSFSNVLNNYYNYYRNKTGYEKRIKERIMRMSKNYKIQIEFAF